ncbi:MAG: EAL domain-containing protein [Caulobacterales bacterium]
MSVLRAQRAGERRKRLDIAARATLFAMLLVVATAAACVAVAAFMQLDLVLPIMLMLAAFILIAAPLTYMAARRFTAPMRRLTEFADEVTAARLGRQIEIQTGDEFQKLAEAFNHMMQRLEGSMKRIQQLAFVDPVTQLPNQERYIRDLNEGITRAVQDRAQIAAIVFEFSQLRRLTVTLDQDAIQELMTLVAKRMASAVRTVDRVIRAQNAQKRPALVACLRNQDFALLVSNMTDAAEAARFAQMINSALNQPFEWRGHKIHLGSSCGVAMAPRDGRDADTVVRHAMMARAAARSGVSGLKVFTKALDREAVDRVNFERQMRFALENNEFRAFFQPKINFATGRIEAAEALARWVRPDRTIISPAKFIPAAEENGLIAEVSDAILREACWKAAAWAREGVPVQVAVNISALQFRNDKFPEHVMRVLEHAGLPPSFLELELTETVAMEDPERTCRLIEPLRSKGVRLAIDDFGCGHSSLSALSKLPFDVIKIDQQFIRGLERRERQAPAIVEAMLAMARTLDLDVVAEGVERREEADFLAERGCRHGQGFLYGAAVPPLEFAALLRAQREAHAASEPPLDLRGRLGVNAA